jgi:hypothetical protein
VERKLNAIGTQLEREWNANGTQWNANGTHLRTRSERVFCYVISEQYCRTELKVQEVCASQSDLLSRYISSRRDIEELRSEFFFKSDKEDVYVFNAPDTFSWFTGRILQIKEIEVILKSDEQLHQSSARKAAICGLGRSGKTSLAVEYAHRMKNHYQGGVFWFSGEDGTKLENSVNSLALSIGTFVSNSFDVTLSQTLARISRIKKTMVAHY